MSTDQNPQSAIRNPQSRILYLFTRTPLHIGAGSSVGAIDQPIVRERHTGFPVIPASSLKGTFADAWNDELKRDEDGSLVRVVAEKQQDKQNDKWVIKELAENAAWLFGSDNANLSWNGVLQFTEARLLAFPIRSARGSFAWITCPLILQRAVRDGLFGNDLIDRLEEPKDDAAVFDSGVSSKLEISGHIVLEEYTFSAANWMGLNKLSETVANLLKEGDNPLDPVWAQVNNRLVILSNGMMSFFAQNACEVAQHVAIDDDKGTAKRGALFNQENVPSETLFYSAVNVFRGRGENFKEKTVEFAWETFSAKVQDKKSIFQFGGDASTGLGYCTVKLNGEKGA